MRVKVLYFASSREAAGVHEEAVELADGSGTADLLDTLKARHAALVSVLRSCVLALNEEYLEPDMSAPLKEGDEVAVIPPLSGG
eukprot:364218-Chlamydomonas_euryale.AAC.17